MKTVALMIAASLVGIVLVAGLVFLLIWLDVTRCADCPDSPAHVNTIRTGR